MRSRNGVSENFKITIDDSIQLTFSFKHQALEEWTQEKWVTAMTIGGVVKQKFLYFHTFFRIDWSQLIVGPDADKLQQVRNAEFNGSKIVITPHIDLPSRYFDVVTLKSSNGDSEQIHFSQIENDRNSLGNRDTVMIFRTKWPQYSWDIRDPSAQQGLTSTAMERFI
jgi:NAD(P)H-hydrate repair Nnr-like enzyme with NAD(P)H-hydrate dehydratase domain